MNKNRSWIFILLFSLSLNIFHGFFTHHHNHSHSDSEVKSYNIDVDHVDLCDKCHCVHLNFTLDFVNRTIDLLSPFKPKFEQLDFALFTNKNRLFKPPTT
jgi:hypothetical protein